MTGWLDAHEEKFYERPKLGPIMAGPSVRSGRFFADTIKRGASIIMTAAGGLKRCSTVSGRGVCYHFWARRFGWRELLDQAAASEAFEATREGSEHPSSRKSGVIVDDGALS